MNHTLFEGTCPNSKKMLGERVALMRSDQRGIRVELGAIIVVEPAQEYGSRTNETSAELQSASHFARWNLLGPSVLHRTVERISRIVPLVSVVGGESGVRCGSKPSPWERAASNYVQSGVRRLLLVHLNGYAELDVADLLQFHGERHSRMTEVTSKQGKVGISLIEAEYLTACRLSHASASRVCTSSYPFSGYHHPLRSPADYRDLALCALKGRCGLRPDGVESDAGVWIARGTKIASSARLQGLCYVGADARIRPGVLLRSGSSVEQYCEIDSGTLVTNSTILPNTYLASGLRVEHSVVDGTTLIRVARNLQVELHETNLLKRTTRHSAWRSLGALDSFSASNENFSLGRSTSFRTLASLSYVRSWFME
jgi:carbonic anhydrase/acetyltransferase-like protein (isoleucine patch superfamily)